MCSVNINISEIIQLSKIKYGNMPTRYTKLVISIKHKLAKYAHVNIEVCLIKHKLFLHLLISTV
jgi:hypothetical protein